MRNWIKSISYNKIQPLCGWWNRLFINPTFHVGLIEFNPFGIWFSDLIVRVNSTKSPKDYNITNPECNLGYIKKSTTHPKKSACRIWGSELLIKVIGSKSPKDFNIAYPECNSGYKQK